MAFNHKELIFWLPNFGFFSHFSASLSDSIIYMLRLEYQKKRTERKELAVDRVIRGD